MTRDVKQCIKSLIPPPGPQHEDSTVSTREAQLLPSKKPRLLDFASISDNIEPPQANAIDTELIAYFSEP